MSTKHRFARQHVSALLGLLLVTVCLSTSAGCTQTGKDVAPAGSSPTAASAAPTNQPAGPEELALVAPLVVGGSLEGFDVVNIHAVNKGDRKSVV